MGTAGVLVFGCSDTSANKGLEADERAILAQQVPVRTVSFGSATRKSESYVEIAETATSGLSSQIDNAVRDIDCKVVKIGALFSDESIKTVSDTLRRRTHLISVMDVEPFFKTGPAPKPELLTALRRDILPSINILSATVPEVKALLDEAEIPVDYPKSVQDVLTMANALRSLGPEYVIIKREILEDGNKMTLLHYVLCGSTEPVMVNSRSENPKGMFGASYSIPPVIAAHLAKGHSVPEAVSAGFKFVEEMLKRGQYFD